MFFKKKIGKDQRTCNFLWEKKDPGLHTVKGLCGFKRGDIDTIFCYYWLAFNIGVQNK